MATYLQGDIVLIPFPFSNLSNSKPRPAIIISNSRVNKTQDIILAQITSNIQNDEFSFPINDKIVTNPLRENCEIRCHKLFTASKEIVLRKISSLKDSNYDKVKLVIDTLIKGNN